MWHIEQDGQPKGPFTDEQMKALCEAKAVRKRTLAWRDGMTNWLPLEETDFPYKHLAADGVAPPTLPTPGSATGRLVPSETLSMWSYFTRCLTSRYATFQGRAKRKEYWSFVLFFWLSLFAAALLGLAIDYSFRRVNGDQTEFKAVFAALGLAIVFFGMFLPHLAALVRRLHDGGFSGWLVLLNLIPYLGGIVVFIFTVLPSEASENKHGPGTLATGPQ